MIEDNWLKMELVPALVMGCGMFIGAGIAWYYQLSVPAALACVIGFGGVWFIAVGEIAKRRQGS